METDDCDNSSLSEDLAGKMVLSLNASGNATNHTTDDDELIRKILPYITTVFYLIICVLGLVGNCLVIYVVLMFAKMKTVTNMYILNLALSDVLFLTMLPILATTSLIQHWVFGLAMCKIYFVLYSTNLFGGVFTLCVMSADRYLAVCHPIRSLRYRTPRIALFLCLCIWSLAFLVMMPIILYSTTVEWPHQKGRYSCRINWPESSLISSDKAFIWYSFILGFALPVSLISVFYVLVVVRLRHVGPAKKSKEKRKSHRRVTRLVLAVVAVYVVCWLPYWLFQGVIIFIHFTNQNKGLIFLFNGCQMLSYANSMLNPFLYAFLSDNFRKTFVKAFKCISSLDSNSTACNESTVFPRASQAYTKSVVTNEERVELTCMEPSPGAAPTKENSAHDDECNNGPVQSSLDYCDNTSFDDATTASPSDSGESQALSVLPYITSVFYMIICVLGLVGNCLVIYVVLMFAKMKTVTNMYILNLALSDVLFLTVLPLLATTAIIRHWIFGFAMCKIYFVMYSINQFGGAFNLCVMSADRYLAVCHPIRSLRYRTPRIALFLCLCIWSVAFLVMMPIILYSTTVEWQHQKGRYSCRIYWPESKLISSDKAFIWYSFILGFALPVSLISVFYVLVVVRLRHVGPAKKSKEKRKSHRRVTRLVLAVVAVYVVCWLPYWLFQGVLVFMDIMKSHPELMFLFHGFTILSYANSMLNPFLYAFLSDNFRKSFVKAFKCVSTFESKRSAGNENSVFPRTSQTYTRSAATNEEKMELSCMDSCQVTSPQHTDQNVLKMIQDDEGFKKLSMSRIDTMDRTAYSEEGTNLGSCLSSFIDCQDWTNTTDALTNLTSPAAGHKKLMDYVIVTCYLVICVFGLLGNGTVIYVILRCPKTKTVTNFYLFNLAVSDVLFLTMMPLMATTVLVKSWIFGFLMCKFYFVLYAINLFGGVFNICVLSGDRYLAVCHPIGSLRYRTPRIALTLCACVWVLSLLAMFPIILFSTTVDNPYNPGLTTCLLSWPAYGYLPPYIWYSFTLGFGLPVALVAIFYTLVIVRLRRVGPGKRTKVKSRRRVTFLVLTLIAVYVICWLPFWCLQVYNVTFTQLSEVKVVVFHAFTVLSYANSMVNPFLYAFLSENFRKIFSKAFKRATKFLTNHVVVDTLLTRTSHAYTRGGASAAPEERVELSLMNAQVTRDKPTSALPLRDDQGFLKPPTVK
ncbi:uncharacterized protein LOC131936237 [Physella acuta]|uniref:uncharacterized protein LOC131936237 n=1 Tax=Physella acuta TaxID=109671 RepID=UPI0027DE31A6|nr:uncharacterized protein LOC131936237 [Physella acuta]